MTPKEYSQQRCNFQKTSTNANSGVATRGNGYCEYHRQKGHTTNECVQLRQLIDKLVKEGRLDHLVKNIKEGKDKQRSGGKKDAPRDKADTIYMVQSWQRKTKQKELSADILYETLLQRLCPEVKSPLNSGPTTSLTGFHGRKSRYGPWANYDYGLWLAIRALHNSRMNFMQQSYKIRQGYSPVRQKKRGQAPERAKAILEEVHKLVEAGIMREVYYHDWLSNPVMVRKSDGSWRMCVDFTDLNKQSTRTLSTIGDRLECGVLMRIPFKVLLGRTKRGINNLMDKDDEEKTAFHTSQGVYCYTKMPFGLKNAGATYQRLVDKRSKGKWDANLDVYVVDLDYKSPHRWTKLVRAPCMFLGYLIEPDGIKPCPEKTKAVIQLPSPRTMKEVQSLNGKLAGLNRFLSKSADKSLPLFKTLKKCTKKGDFRWTTAAEEAFTQLKQHIAALPTLVAPRPGEELIMYLSATHGAISAVLLTDRDSVQTPVYFVSKALKETEINYSAMEKLILALVFAAKRLRRYFQAHPIVVITDQPIKQVISKPDALGRLKKWSVLLREHNISYRPRTIVKGQILADFLIEKPETDAVLPQSEVNLQEPWILFTDGSSCVDGSGAGLILTNPEGMEFTYALRFEFTATNN
ncbi:reverse transcriptase domain-containing protein [Tanacetum coccineum]